MPNPAPQLTLYAATTNPGKLREFATSAATSNIAILPLPNLAEIPAPTEDAATFLGNAEKKAIAYSLAAPTLLVFADDSGLEVDALGGDPGVRSARFADDAGYLAAPHPHPLSNCHPEEQSDERPASLPPSPGAQPFRSSENPGAPRLASETWDPQQQTPKPLTTDARNNALLLARVNALPPETSRAARFVCALALARDGHILLRAEGTLEGQIITEPRGTNGFGYDPLFLIPSLGLTTAELPPTQKWSLSHRGNAFRNLLTQLPKLNLSE